MAQLYARVFVQVLDSSLAQNFQARHVFEDLLKLCDNGIVDMTREAIARRINVPLELVNAAITYLESPDPNSRDPSEDGRRIVRLDGHRDWGWRIVNWESYERIRNRRDDHQRQSDRERQRRHRAKVAANKEAPPSPTPPTSEGSTHSDSDSEVTVKSQAVTNVTVTGVVQELSRGVCELFQRKASDRMTYFEESTLVELSKRPDVLSELSELKAFREKSGRYFPQSLKSLLEGWEATLDRARNSKVASDPGRANDARSTLSRDADGLLAQTEKWAREMQR